MILPFYMYFVTEKDTFKEGCGGGIQFTFQSLNVSYKGERITLQQPNPVSIQGSQHY